LRAFARRKYRCLDIQRRIENRAGYDRRDNAASRLSDGEHVWMPMVWIVELYTPTTIGNLLDGLLKLMDKQARPMSDRDPVGWVREHRRSGRRGSHGLPTVRASAGGPFVFDTIVDRMPAHVQEISLDLHALSTTVTALVSGFRIDPEYSQSIEAILNRDVSTTFTRLRSGNAMHDVRQRKAQAIADWRREVRDAAAAWLAGCLDTLHAPTRSSRPRSNSYSLPGRGRRRDPRPQAQAMIGGNTWVSACSSATGSPPAFRRCPCRNIGNALAKRNCATCSPPEPL
jgi:hypothetical protein